MALIITFISLVLGYWPAGKKQITANYCSDIFMSFTVM